MNDACRSKWRLTCSGSNVVEQNVDRISREIAYVPLGERIRSKRSSYMQPFFLLKKMITRHAYQGLRQNGDFGYASQRTKDLGFWTCSPEIRGFEFWTCFLEIRWIWSLELLEVRWIWSLIVLLRGLTDLNFGHASQRSKNLL